MHHKDELDYIIMNALNSDNYGFNKLCGESEISPKTLSIHLRKLKEQGMTEWYPPKEYGKRGKWELTPVGKSYLQYGLELDIESKRRKKEAKEHEMKRNDDGENLLLFRLLLSTAAVGTKYVKVISKPSSGDLAVKNASKGNWEVLRVTIKEGVSIQDIVDRRTADLRFSFIETSKEELENLIDKLSKGKNAILRPIKSEDGEIRFGIADLILKDFLCDCYMILEAVIRRMEYTWTFVRCAKKGRNKQKQSPEVEWYSRVCGNRYTEKFFASIDEIRRYQYDIDREECTQLLNHYRWEFKGKSPTEEDLSKMHKKASYDHDIRFNMKRKEDHVKFDDDLIRMHVTNLDKHKSVYDHYQLEERYPIVKIIRKNIFHEFLSNYQKLGKV